MNTLTTFAVLLLSGLACSSPTTNSDILYITEEFYDSSLSIYTAPNNIIRLLTPLNALNFDEDEDDDDESESVYIFFVEGETDSEGNTVYKGLSVLKDRQVTRLLDNGRDSAAAAGGESKKVFFGASDGIYVFNETTNSADRYGTINEDIIGIEVENGTDTIYILTSGNVIYKVTEQGTVKEELTKIPYLAHQIALDFLNNLYFVDVNRQVYVYTEGEVRKIDNLPQHPSYVQLVRPPFVLEEGIPVVIGKKAYSVYPNGTSEFAEIVLNNRPTAYSMEATLIHYYAYNKQIYEYNILALIMGELLEGIKSYFSDNVEAIQSIATRSRSDFRA